VIKSPLWKHNEKLRKLEPSNRRLKKKPDSMITLTNSGKQKLTKGSRMKLAAKEEILRTQPRSRAEPKAETSWAPDGIRAAEPCARAEEPTGRSSSRGNEVLEQEKFARRNTAWERQSWIPGGAETWTGTNTARTRDRIRQAGNQKLVDEIQSTGLRGGENEKLTGSEPKNGKRSGGRPK
jgi:hypothetical protein